MPPKEINKSVLLIIFLSIMMHSCQQRYKSKEVTEEEPKVFNKILFTQKLDSALIFLTEVCGEDGINKVCILHSNDIVYIGNKCNEVQRIWSCTKSFTSTVLGILITEGKCRLDDKVCKYVPEMKNFYPEVTFRHFATMTSGYRAEGDEPRGDYVHGPSYTPQIPSSQRLFAPGTKFRYWDSAMNMFAYALTKVAGEPIRDLFKRKIADPIGMDSTKWEWKSYIKLDGHDVAGGAGNNGWGISLSATEFARFGQFLLQEGKWEGEELLPSEWIQSASSAQIKNIIPGDDTPYGFNWWTSGIFPDAPDSTFAAFGFNNNKCIIIPEWDMVIVRLGLDGNIDNEYWNNFLKIVGEAFEE